MGKGDPNVQYQARVKFDRTLATGRFGNSYTMENLQWDGL
jgi:hypothetical protein